MCSHLLGYCDNTNQPKSSDSIKNQLSNSDIRLSYNKPQTFFVNLQYLILVLVHFCY